MRISVCLMALLSCAQFTAASDVGENGNLVRNGMFGADLSGWRTETQNATVTAQRTYDTWHTYSLTFNTKAHKAVYFYVNVRPGKYTGGQVWFDRIRGKDVKIENGSFEDCDVTGLAKGWDPHHIMYNEMKRHAKQVIGTDFQYASDGVLSMRFFGPEQRNMWKLAMLPAPKRMAEGWKPRAEMSPWRPLVEGTMRLSQRIEVTPDTTYTISMDYRFDKNFYGIIRPVVGYNFQPYGILAHSGWKWSAFHELYAVRDRFGASFATMTISNGLASVAQDVSVVPGEQYQMSADILTTRIYNKKALEMDIRLVCEDVGTGRIVAETRYDWDGAPGHTATAIKDKDIQGASTTLQCHFVSPSKTIRMRIVATAKGAQGKVILGDIELSKTPTLIPPVQQAQWKSAKENFQIRDKLTYAVCQGDAGSINGALWLVAKDLKKKKIVFTPDAANANVTISIGTYREHGEEGYRLTVDRKGIRIESATPRGAQYALMTLLQLIGNDVTGGKVIVGADIVDWPDMPLRGVVMEGCSHFVPRQKNPVRLTDIVYHDNLRQTWCLDDFLQLVRWKLNTVWWRSTGYSDKLDKECRRFHIDSMRFVSTISDPPTPQMFVDHPDWIEGVYVQDEEVKCRGVKPTLFAHPHILRTADTDIIVRNETKTTTYAEGKDYRVVGKFGRIAISRKFVESEPFGIARLEGSRIPSDGTVYVSYDYIEDFGAKTTWHYQYCLNHPDAVAAVGESVRKNAAAWNCAYLHIRGDELSIVNRCSRCRKRGMKTCDLLIEHIEFLSNKAREGNPDVQVCMWNDSLSPYTTGSAWGFNEEGPAPPNDVWQLVWHYGPGMPTDVGWAEVKLCQKFGLKTIVLPWYNMRNIREWAQVVKAARARNWNCMGIMDTPWGHPGPYPNFRELAMVSWKVPKKGEKRFVEFIPPPNLD